MELDAPGVVEVMTSKPPLSVTFAPATEISPAQLAAVSQCPEMVTVSGEPPSTVTIRSWLAVRKSNGMNRAPVYVPAAAGVEKSYATNESP